MAGKFEDFEVIEKTVESDIITSFFIRPKQGKIAAFIPGEYLIVEVPAGDGGAMLRREYSISGQLNDCLRLTIKREPSVEGYAPGAVSGYFHDHISVGDSLRVAGPAGKFTLDRHSARPVVLLSGGVGQTPLVAMARELAKEGKRRVIFVHACEDGNVHAFQNEMRDLAESYSGLTTHFCYRLPTAGTRPGRDCDSTGFISRGTLQSLLHIDDYEFYLCGPAPFMQAMYDMLFELGVPLDRVKYEFFGPASVLRPKERISDTQSEKPVKQAKNGSQPMVTFAKSGLSVPWDPEIDNLLEFAEEQGLMPDFSCRAGTCDTCKTKVLSGETAYEPEPFERPTDGTVLLCCCQPSGNVTLDL